ncbi:MAG: hypothetical protein GWO81_06785 [Verrucomicrobia bacterium]|nr:hypothetical protein [Verrucomicrobiota bacterium]
MKNTERIFVYFIGFLIGLLMVTAILMRRAAREEAAIADPWAHHIEAAAAVAAEPLPPEVEPAMLKGTLLGFGQLPASGTPRERVWIMNFEDSYPYVRIVQELQSGTLHYMAADQIKLKLAPGVDVAELSPLLDTLGLRLRNFNRKHGVVVLGVLNTSLEAVPQTLAALEPWAELIERAEPDTIRFRQRPD